MKLSLLTTTLIGTVLASSSLAKQAPISRHHLSSAQYQDLVVDYHSQGYRLQQVSGYERNGTANYAAIWRKESGPDLAAHHGMSSQDYQTKAEDYDALGFRITWVDGYRVGNQTYFAAIWEKQSGPPMIARHHLTSAQYQDQFLSYQSQGFRCVHVDGYRTGNGDRYAALWVKDGGPFPRAHHGQSAASYQATVEQNIQDGYRPIRLSAWGSGNSSRYASLWEKSSGHPFWMRHLLNSQQYQAEAENFHYTGYQVENVDGYVVNGQVRFIAYWENPHMKASDLNLIENRIRSYMQDQGIPGVSVAIAKTGRLVYARGFGFADLEDAELVSPSSRMRVASISKPITATAILTLVDQGVLSLEDRVFGQGALLGTQYGTTPYSAAVKAIRVKHLLWHCSGWSNEGDDPMFNNHANHTAVINWMVNNRDPLANPEAQDEYLNFGYCVLGRIIEEVTGQTYEAYVRDQVLQPCGIQDMVIGAKTKANQKAKEATYYYGNSPYSVIRPRHFDSHGGWIASATDLLRFKVRVDGSAAKPDILSGSAYAAMMEASPASSARAMGWLFGNNGHGHNGCMSGTIGFLWDTDDGYTFAILANTRPEDDGCAWQARAMLEDILYDVSAWPQYDLFSGSHQKVNPIIVNPNLAPSEDLVFKSPTILPELPKFEIVQLPQQDLIPGRMDVLKVPLKRPDSAPQPALTTQRVSVRGGAALHLAFPTEEGFEYLLERSVDGQHWTAEAVKPGREKQIERIFPATEAVELFRVQVVPEEDSEGRDPTRIVSDHRIVNTFELPGDIQRLVPAGR